jgi:hypothetical protein
MKTFILALTLTLALILTAPGHGSQGYAPDEYWRVTTPIHCTDYATNQHTTLPPGTIVHVLWYSDHADTSPHGLAYIQTNTGITGQMPWKSLWQMQYMGQTDSQGNRPF